MKLLTIETLRDCSKSFSTCACDTSVSDLLHLTLCAMHLDHIVTDFIVCGAQYYPGSPKRDAVYEMGLGM